jgi:excinuclease UvrABC nuclease subunit
MSMTLAQLKKLPDAPGVYFFLGRNKKILYIGKATSLRSRVRSYLVEDIATVRSPLIAQMVQEATHVDHRTTDSVLEALILEADLIKKFRPEFNTKEKDDKSFYCVTLTKEDFPVISLARKKDINFETMMLGDTKLKAVYGPYPEGMSIKEGLKIIRKIFPYRDEKCKITPVSKACFNYQIGLCPGTCVHAISKKQYAVTIRNIELFFKGKKQALLTLLTKEMNKLVKDEAFEAAAVKRNQIWALEHIRDVSLLKKESLAGTLGEKPFRIEAYDIAHMSGKDMVGVMVVMENGEFNKNEYRKFIIKGFGASNDTGALREMLVRRNAHAEWQKADLVVIDGGQAQINVATELFDPQVVASVVKDDKHRAREIMGDKAAVDKYRQNIISINAEAHRCAIAFHKKRRNKTFLLH